MITEKQLCGSCKFYGFDVEMSEEIWEEWDGENETWGHSYVCPKCGRRDGRE